MARKLENSKPTVYPGNLTLGGIEISCFTVDFHDGNEPQRLLSGRGVTGALGLTGRGPGMARFLANKKLRATLKPEIIALIEHPVKFPVGGLEPAQGYSASILPELCWAIIDANDLAPFPANQQPLVAQAKILQRAFGEVGIKALVDEATGFQYARAQDALQQILNLFISDELRKWAKTFPDEFYRQLFRLRGIEFTEFSSKRPAYFGHLTNDIVWKRLAPSVLEELQRVTPRDHKGRRKHKYFQRLTENIGHPKLREHLMAVIALMKAADSWDQFIKMIDRSLPKFSEQFVGQQLILPSLEQDHGGS